MTDLGLDVTMPPFLNGRRQFTIEESNESRCLTKVRWVVEAVNARIKQFKFFANTVQNSSVPSLEAYLKIVYSIINRYQSPISTSSPKQEEIGRKMLELLNQKRGFESVS